MALSTAAADDVEILTPPRSERCYVLTLCEVVHLRELLAGARLMLDLMHLALQTDSTRLGTLLLLGIERIRQDLRANFSQAVSGTDLIVGARTGPVQLLLYSVFRIGNATNNIRVSSIEAIAKHRAVAWTVPLSLGDSHRGYPVLGTTAAYFKHFAHGDTTDVVIPSDVGSQHAERTVGIDIGSRDVVPDALEEGDHVHIFVGQVGFEVAVAGDVEGGEHPRGAPEGDPGGHVPSVGPLRRASSRSVSAAVQPRFFISAASVLPTSSPILPAEMPR